MPIDELVFVQGPVMTDRHVHALQRMDAVWCFPDEFERKLIGEVLRHVEVVVAMAKEGTRMARMNTEGEHRETGTPGFLDDWQVVWRPLTVEEIYESEQ